MTTIQKKQIPTLSPPESPMSDDLNWNDYIVPSYTGYDSNGSMSFLPAHSSPPLSSSDNHLRRSREILIESILRPSTVNIKGHPSPYAIGVSQIHPYQCDSGVSVTTSDTDGDSIFSGSELDCHEPITGIPTVPNDSGNSSEVSEFTPSTASSTSFAFNDTPAPDYLINPQVLPSSSTSATPSTSGDPGTDFYDNNDKMTRSQSDGPIYYTGGMTNNTEIVSHGWSNSGVNDPIVHQNPLLDNTTYFLPPYQFFRPSSTVNTVHSVPSQSFDHGKIKDIINLNLGDQTGPKSIMAQHQRTWPPRTATEGSRKRPAQWPQWPTKKKLKRDNGNRCTRPPKTPTQKDDYLLGMKKMGVSYKDIKERGGYKEAESTLRGRFRTLTKSKEARVRKPRWHANDVSIDMTNMQDLS